MKSLPSLRVVLAVAAVLTLTAHVVLDAVDVHVEHDKMFDFRPIRTWGWNPAGAGRVMMARTKDDDPEAMKQRVDPIVREAVHTAVVASLTDVARSVRLLVERARVVAEGAGATPVACALGNHGVRGKIVCVVSGGNIDLKTLLELLSAW